MEHTPVSASDTAEPSAGHTRWRKAIRLVEYHALAAAGLGIIPIPILDTALIVGTQLKMLSSLARHYDVRFSEQLGKSAIAALIGGSLPMSASSWLKLLPGIGQLLGLVWFPAVSGASTYAVGMVFIQHFEVGGNLLDFDPEKLRGYYREQFAKQQGSLDEEFLDLKIEQPAEAEPVPNIESRSEEEALVANPTKCVISSIRFFGAVKGVQSDEFVEIRNIGEEAQDISNWSLRSDQPNQTFTFPDWTVLAPNESVRVYTKLDAPQPNCFSFESQRALWNDKGDLAYLSDATGRIVDKYGYGDKETRTIDSITTAFGVSGLSVKYYETQLAEQKQNKGRVDFLSAVEDALRSLLEDPPRALQDTIRTRLRGQQLILTNGEALPEGLISVKNSWIFRLVPGVSARHFIIVNRAGTRATAQKLS